MDYLSQYDYIQKNLSRSTYHSGKISKVRVTLVSSSNFNKELTSQINLFFYNYALNFNFSVITRNVKAFNKGEESLETLYLESILSKQENINSFLKTFYLELLSKDFGKNIKYQCENGISYINVKVPLDQLFVLEDLYKHHTVDLKDTFVYFKFYLKFPVEHKKDLKKIFPFWMND